MSTEAGWYLDAFKLHDQEGFPLTCSIAAGQERGISVNVAAFACDALKAGWSDDKVYLLIAEARADNGLPFDRAAFREKLAELWALSGGAKAPECWDQMKRFLSREDLVKTP